MQEGERSIDTSLNNAEAEAINKTQSLHEFHLHASRQENATVVTRIDVDGNQVFPGRTPKAQLRFKDLGDLETWLVRKIAPAAKVDHVEYPEVGQRMAKDEPVPEYMYNAPVKLQLTKVRRSISPAEGRGSGASSFFSSPVPSVASKLFSEAPKSQVKLAGAKPSQKRAEIEQPAEATQTNAEPELSAAEELPTPLNFAADLFPDVGDDSQSVQSDSHVPSAPSSTDRGPLRRSTSSTSIKAKLRPAADLFGSSGSADVGLDYFSVDKTEPVASQPAQKSLANQQYGSAADLFGGASSDFASSPFASPPSSTYTHSPPVSASGSALEAVTDIFAQPAPVSDNAQASSAHQFQAANPQVPTLNIASPASPQPVLAIEPHDTPDKHDASAADVFGASSPVTTISSSFDAAAPNDQPHSSPGLEQPLESTNAESSSPPAIDQSISTGHEGEPVEESCSEQSAADVFGIPAVSVAEIPVTSTLEPTVAATPPTSQPDNAVKPGIVKSPGSASSSDRGSTAKPTIRPQAQPLPDLFGSAPADDIFSTRSPPTRAASMMFDKPAAITTTSSPGGAHPPGPKRSISELPPAHTFMSGGSSSSTKNTARPAVISGSPFGSSNGAQNEAAALFSQTMPEEYFRHSQAGPSPQSAKSAASSAFSGAPPSGDSDATASDLFSNPPPSSSFSPSMATHKEPAQTKQQQKPSRPISHRSHSNHLAMALLAGQSQPSVATPPSSAGSQPSGHEGQPQQQLPPTTTPTTTSGLAAGASTNPFSRTYSHSSMLQNSLGAVSPTSTASLPSHASFYGSTGMPQSASTGHYAQASQSPIVAATGGAHPTHRQTESLPNFQQYGVSSPAAPLQKRPSGIPRVTHGKPAGPVVSFGYGGKLCVMFPKADTRQFMGVPSGHNVKHTCGPVQVMKLTTIVSKSESLDVKVDPLLRPITATMKQSEVISIVDNMLRVLSSARAQPSTITLLRVLRCLVEGNGSVSSTEGMADPSSPESRLVRLLNSTDAAAPAAAEPSRGFLGFGSRAATQPDAPEMQAASMSTDASAALYERFLQQHVSSATTVTAGDLQGLETMLLEGRRAEAARAAAEMKLWGPALLFASVCEKEVYQEIAKLCIGASFPKGSPLNMVALLYAGVADDAIKHGGKTLNQHAGAPMQIAGFGHTASSSSLQATWKRMLAAIIANKTTGWQQLVRNLGQRLETELCDFAAAHVCYVAAGVLPSPAIFRQDRSQGAYTLLSVDLKASTVFSPQVMYGLKFTEILEWCICQNSKDPGLSVLSPLKLAYANFLADLGYMSEAEAYLVLCKETFNAINQKAKRASKGPKATKPSGSQFPPLHEYLLHVSEDRLLQSQNKAAVDHRALNKTWLGGAMSLLENSFRKIVDEPQPPAAGTIQPPTSSEGVPPAASTAATVPPMTSGPAPFPGSPNVAPSPAQYATPYGYPPTAYGNQPTPYASQQAPSAGASSPFPGMVDVSLSSPQHAQAPHSGFGYQQPSSFQTPHSSTPPTTTHPMPQASHPSAPFGMPSAGFATTPKPAELQQPQPQPQQPQQQPAQTKQTGQKSPTPAKPDKKATGETSPSKSGGILGWLGFGGGKKSADLGDQMEAYFDKTKNAWVFPGQEEEEIKPLAPPPTAVSAPASVGPSATPSGNDSEAYDPLAALMAPPPRSAAAADPLAALMAPPARGPDSGTYGSAPPSAMGGPPTGPSSSGSGPAPMPQYTVFTPFPTASTATATTPAPGSAPDQQAAS